MRLGWRRLNWEAWGKVFIPWRERWGIVGYERRGFEGIKRMVGGAKNEGQGDPQLGGRSIDENCNTK